MNTHQPNQVPVTLESIAEQKAALLQQIRRQKQTMTHLTRELLAPIGPAAARGNSMMRAFNTGMAVFDGVMLGLKMMRKFKKFFWRRPFS